MESSSPGPRPSKSLIIKLVIGLVVVAAGGLLLLRGVDLKALGEQGLTFIRDAGPLVFFGAMAILPALGFPLSPFTVSAGPAFGPVLGLGWVLAAAFAAVFCNVMLGYCLARWVMHPVLERLVVRLGYKLPRIPPDQYWDWSILLRVTPGPPFFVQNFILGLSHVPMRIYLTASLAVSWAYTAGLVIFGDALIHGKGRNAVFGIMFLVIVIFGVQLLRKHLAKKKAASAAMEALSVD